MRLSSEFNSKLASDAKREQCPELQTHQPSCFIVAVLLSSSWLIEWAASNSELIYENILTLKQHHICFVFYLFTKHDVLPEYGHSTTVCICWPLFCWFCDKLVKHLINVETESPHTQKVINQSPNPIIYTLKQQQLVYEYLSC